MTALFFFKREVTLDVARVTGFHSESVKVGFSRAEPPFFIPATAARQLVLCFLTLSQDGNGVF